MNIGSCSVTVAELWGLFQSLSVAWKKGTRWLNVELDSLCVTQLFDNRLDYPNGSTLLARFVKDLLRRDWHINIIYVNREQILQRIFLQTMPCLSLWVFTFSTVFRLVFFPFSRMICMGLHTPA